MKYISRKKFDIKKFMKQNEGAQFAGHLEPGDYDWSDFPYLYCPCKPLQPKNFNLGVSFKLHYCNPRLLSLDSLYTIFIHFKDSKVLIKASAPDEFWFYDFNKLNKEFHDKINNMLNEYISQQNEVKGLIIENGWLDIKEELVFENKDDIFEVIVHPEFKLYKPQMRITAFEKTFYIDLPDNDICKQKFAEWIERHTLKNLVEKAINKLEND